MTERYEVVVTAKECGLNKLQPFYKQTFGIWDCKKCMSLPCCFETDIEARVMCDLLNELAKEYKNNKPKPLKEEILEALGEIDISKYDMQNKILKQKEHIKELETKIKHLKNDVKNNQRSIDRLTKQDIENNNKYMCRVEEIDRLKCCNRELKREKEAYRKRFIKIQEEIDCTYIPVPSKFNKIKRIMEGYYD